MAVISAIVRGGAINVGIARGGFSREFGGVGRLAGRICANFVTLREHFLAVAPSLGSHGPEELHFVLLDGSSEPSHLVRAFPGGAPRRNTTAMDVCSRARLI
jgi:hypothetical protein